jgi:hypothetical protein
MRAGMMASRLNHRERVIPALTDHTKRRGGVIGPASFARRSNVVNLSYGVARGSQFRPDKIAFVNLT